MMEAYLFLVHNVKLHTPCTTNAAKLTRIWTLGDSCASIVVLYLLKQEKHDAPNLRRLFVLWSTSTLKVTLKLRSPRSPTAILLLVLRPRSTPVPPAKTRPASLVGIQIAHQSQNCLQSNLLVSISIVMYASIHIDLRIFVCLDPKRDAARRQTDKARIQVPARVSDSNGVNGAIRLQDTKGGQGKGGQGMFPGV